MPIFNYKAKEMIVKIVYYGPGLCGKTTSLQCLHERTIQERKGELYFLATETDQTIYFELLPLYVGELNNFKLRFQVYTVPGQVKYNNTRKAVLQGVDAIVFVADSQRSRRQANQVSLENLKYNLKGGYNLNLDDLPLVYEYNKRDMADILTLDELNQDVNPRNLPYFETIATEGVGVVEAFETISSLAIQNLEKRLSQAEGKQAVSRTSAEPAAPTKSLHLFTDEAPDETGPEAPPWEIETPREFAGSPLDEEDQMMVSARDSEIFTVSDEQDKHLSYVDILAATYHDGEIIFEEGDPGDEMYFIEEGKVKIVGSYKDTKKILITYEKGDFFGEMILFGGKTRSARAVALGTTRLIPVTRETLASQIQVKPEIALALLETLSNRIRKNTRTISKLADQNKELMHRLRKAHTTMKQLIEQNKQLQQSSSDGATS